MIVGYNQNDIPRLGSGNFRNRRRPLGRRGVGRANHAEQENRTQ
jgi:hypothetical protein